MIKKITFGIALVSLIFTGYITIIGTGNENIDLIAIGISFVVMIISLIIFKFNKKTT